MFPAERHPQFGGFASVDRYCEAQGERWAAGGAEAGKWPGGKSAVLARASREEGRLAYSAPPARLSMATGAVCLAATRLPPAFAT